jgi:hypothetical protein
MAISPVGPLALTDIQTEFGGSNPISLSEYYAGGGLVQSGATGDNGAIPSSGQIEMSKFFGAAAVTPMEFLVIAGGGGGGMGAGFGGGGGAGGMRTSSETDVAPGTVITASIGGGGGSTANRFQVGTNGQGSSITSPGVTNVSCTGGGRGGSQDVFTPNHGGALGGGSGGGGATANPGPASGGCNNDVSNPASVSGSGGTGVVIMNVPTSKYTGTTTGSPQVSTSGPLTIIKFTGSGSYTA